jgi:Fic family protein
MGGLLEWYRNEEQRGKLKAEELTALFHYRYIRIHPFEDGNGRIVRLLVNYILLRNNYPMLVIRSDDRQNYLKALRQCDLLTGKNTSDGAHATLQQVKPLIDYISVALESKLTALIQLAKGEILELVEAKDDEKSGQKKVIRKSGTVNDTVNDTVNQEIIELIQQMPEITIDKIVIQIGKSRRTVIRRIQKLKTEGMIERIGGDKGGYWKIK